MNTHMQPNKGISKLFFTKPTVELCLLCISSELKKFSYHTMLFFVFELFYFQSNIVVNKKRALWLVYPSKEVVIGYDKLKLSQ